MEAGVGVGREEPSGAGCVMHHQRGGATMGVAGRAMGGFLAVVALVASSTASTTAATPTSAGLSRGKVITFTPSLIPDDAQDLANLIAAGQQVTIARLAFEVIPAPPLGEPYSGALQLRTLQGGSPSVEQTVRGHLVTRRESLLQAPEQEAGDLDYVEDLLALSAPFAAPAVDLDRDDPVLEALVVSFATARGYATDTVSRTDPAPPREPLAPPSGHVGWAPDVGNWYFKYDKPVVNSFGVVLGHDYEFSVGMSWSAASKMQKLRGSDAKGFEFSFAFLAQTGRAVQSGEYTRMPSFMTDFPGAYEETVTFDDTNQTFGVGTHEAEKLRWAYQTSPSFYETYFIDMKLQDPYDQRQQTPKPAFSIGAQYDIDMLCGGSAAADACFFSNGGGDFVPGWCTYVPRNPAQVVRWDYRGTTFLEQCPT